MDAAQDESSYGAPRPPGQACALALTGSIGPRRRWAADESVYSLVPAADQGNLASCLDALATLLRKSAALDLRALGEDGRQRLPKLAHDLDDPGPPIGLVLVRAAGRQAPGWRCRHPKVGRSVTEIPLRIQRHAMCHAATRICGDPFGPKEAGRRAQAGSRHPAGH